MIIITRYFIQLGNVHLKILLIINLKIKFNGKLVI